MPFRPGRSFLCLRSVLISQELSVILPYIFPGAVIFYHDNFVIIIGRFLPDGVYAPPQILHMILVGYNDGNLRCAHDLVANPENSLEGPCALDLEMLISMPPQMLRHRPLGRRYGVGLGPDAGGHAARMAPPIIHQSGHMDNFFRPVREPKNHVVILTAVEFGPEQLVSLQKPSGKHAEMADIVVGPEIVRRIIGLEVHGKHMIDIVHLKGGLITVEVVRPLLVDGLHILIQHAGMQHIVLIQKAHILPRSHLQAGIGVAGNTSVFLQLLIDNPALRLRLILPADLLYIGVGFVGAVRKTKLPVPIGLIHDGLKHLHLKVPVIVPQGHQNADLHHPGKHRLPLLLGLLRPGKAQCAELLHGLPLALFIPQLGHHSSGAAAVFQPVLLPDRPMHRVPCRPAGLPEGIFFDAVQFPLQLLAFRLQIRHPCRQIGALQMLLLICLLVIHPLQPSCSLFHSHISDEIPLPLHLPESKHILDKPQTPRPLSESFPNPFTALHTGCSSLPV